MEVYIFDKKEDLYNELSRRFIKEIKENPNINLGLSSGSTPIPLYEKLILDHKENKTSYKNVTAINLDEYIGISEDDAQSYRTFMNDFLFNHLDIDMNNTHVPLGSSKDLLGEIHRFDTLLKNNPIDIQLLSIGTNAHVGFNEPGCRFDSATNIVELTEETKHANKRFFDSYDSVPSVAITMGMGSIMKSNKIILIATGPLKAKAIANTIEGPITTNVPASILQTHPNIKVYLDKEAASLLSKAS